MKCDLKMAERPLAPQSHSIAEEPWSLEVTGDTKQAAQEIKDGRKLHIIILLSLDSTTFYTKQQLMLCCSSVKDKIRLLNLY